MVELKTMDDVNTALDEVYAIVLDIFNVEHPVWSMLPRNELYEVAYRILDIFCQDWYPEWMDGDEWVSKVWDHFYDITVDEFGYKEAE